MIKRYTYAILVAGVVIILAALVLATIIARKKNNIYAGSLVEDITTLYEKQLLIDAMLQNQVENFSLPENIRVLFQKHEKELQSFAEQCYKNRKEQSRFFVEYINNKPFYFTTADAMRGSNLIEEKNAIKKGKYDDITAFMDYAVDNQLVFRDWMLEIGTPNPVDEDEFQEKRNNNYGATLSITIYKGSGLYIAFVYSPYDDVDYSYEYYGMAVDGPRGGQKIVRIDSHWYYEYRFTQGEERWCPDPKEHGFNVNQ